MSLSPDDTTTDATDSTDTTDTADTGDDASTSSASSDSGDGTDSTDSTTSDTTDSSSDGSDSDTDQQSSDSDQSTSGDDQDWSSMEPGGSGHDGPPEPPASTPDDSDDTSTDASTTSDPTDGTSSDSETDGSTTDSQSSANGQTAAPPASSGSSSASPAGSGAAGSTPSKNPQAASGNYIATLFTFQLNPGESIGARIVRCCNQALTAGPMGQTQRSDFYRDFIAGNQEKTQQAAQALIKVTTSCAMFVRAVREWCGAPASGPYRPGTGMFVSMGNVSVSSPAFVKLVPGAKPNPGDYFYIANSLAGNDTSGHTGIFISQNSDGSWQTAEGGGPPDGTMCRLTSRTISGQKFTNDARTLWGWFDCTKVGLPTS